MTEEDTFHVVLDKDPQDFNTRAALADFLLDRDDPRAHGYLAIVKGKIVPEHASYRSPAGWYTLTSPNAAPNGSFEWWVMCIGSVESYNLPEMWVRQLTSPYTYPYSRERMWRDPDNCNHLESVDYASRREAEDDLALAFLKLPEWAREYLLTEGFTHVGWRRTARGRD